MSDRTQDIKNLRAVATACKNYTDKKIEDLRWELGTYDLGVESDNTSALVKTMPSGTIKANVNKIYGASEVMVNDFDSNLTSISDDTGVTHSKVGNSYVIVNSSSTSSRIVLNKNLNEKHTIVFDSDTAISYGFRINSLSLQNNIVVGKNIFEDIAFTGNNPISIYVPANSTVTISNIVSTTNYFTNIHNLELSGLVVKNSDDEVMQTKTIDLSTILYNGSPLFEGNSLKAVGTAKDYIMPYKAHKQMGYIDLGTIDYSINNSNFPSVFVSNDLANLIKSNMPNVVANILCANYNPETRNNMVQGQIDKTISIGAYNTMGTYLYICDETYSGNPTALKTALSGVYLVYELATPIEADIDLSHLKNIQGYSNGSITAQNTYDMATTSEIDYLVEEVKA